MAQIREEVGFTKGRIIVRGKLVSRGKAKRADYVLYYKPNIPIALIEAKDNNCSVGDGMQQALDYADDPQHPLRVFLERRRLCVPRPHRPTACPSGNKSCALRRSRHPQICGRAIAPGRALTLQARGDRPTRLLRRRQRQRRRATTRSTPSMPQSKRSPRAEPRAAGHGDRNRQNLHRLPDHLASVEGRAERSAFSSSPTATCSSTRRW